MIKRKKISKKIMLATLTTSMIVGPLVLGGEVKEVINNSEIVLGSKVTSESTSQVSIIESKGWMESASVEWKAVKGATSYNVYYKGEKEADSKYKKLDSKLVREYTSYFRADAVGIKEGKYILKVVPVINGKESTSAQAISKAIDVKANVREGFAFSDESPMKTASGGYNDDGSLANSAKILYITKDTVNTVKLDIITNNKGKVTSCTGLKEVLEARKKGYDKTPLVIRMIGEIKSSDIKGLNSNGYLEIKGNYNITFEGIGEDATANGWGFLIRDSHNVELRNVGVMLFPDDGISLDTDNENIWIHNNDVFYGTAGSDKDQAKGDGSCDTKKSDYITISYNHFYDSGKTSLCGMSDTEEFKVTYHHNWFDHSDSRHPRIRVGTVHIYNNYFDGNSKYGVGVTKGASAFVESNVFRNCKYPMLSSLQGTDISEGSKGTFSNEAGGMIKAFNNSVEGASSLVYTNSNSKQFDAYLAKSKNEKVPNSYKTVSGNTTYNNFDTSSNMYKYTPDDTNKVVESVTTYSGRVNGGDFTWKFTNADDKDYSVNEGLMNKLKEYKSDLKSVGK